MSLINTMLKDLETRQRTPKDDQSPRDLYRDLRPVRRSRHSYRTLMLSVGLSVAIMATATLLFARGHWDPSKLPTVITQWAGVLTQDVATSATNTVQPEHKDVGPGDTIDVSGAEKVKPMQTAALVETRQLVQPHEMTTTHMVSAATTKDENVPLNVEPKAKHNTDKRPETKAKAKTKVTKQPKATTAARKENPKKPATVKKMVSVKNKKPVNIRKKQPVVIASIDPNITNSSLSEVSEHGVVERKFRTLTPADEAERVYRDAVESLKQNRVGDAEERLRSAVTTDPRHTESLELLAGLLLRRGSLVEAEQLLNDGRAANPEAYRLAQLLARIYIQRGASDQALALLEQSRSYAKTDAEFFGFLAALYQRDGQHDKAIEAYGRAVTIDPQRGQWWLGLGISFEAESNWSAAHQAYRRAVAGRGLNRKLGQYARQRLASVARRVSSN